MDQQKTGSFLKELRKGKRLTQEQLAEHQNVSTRTISRWETGSNMPDLSILIEIADFYDVDIRELIDGERKHDAMDKETKDTLKKVATYADDEKRKFGRRVADITAGILIVFGAYLFLHYSGLAASDRPYENLSNFALGITTGTLILNILYCTGILDKASMAKRAWLNKREIQKDSNNQSS